MAIRKVSFENPHFTGTEAAKMPVGTTAQRANAVVGDLRFNTTLDQMEQYTSDSGWQGISAPPVIVSVDVNNIDAADDPQTIVITGTGFDVGATAVLLDSSLNTVTPTTSTRNSDTQITIVYSGGDTITTDNGPYDVRVTNGSSLQTSLENAVTLDDLPAWSTASGNIGTVYEGSAMSTISVTATDPEGETVSYSVTSGALPTGVSLSSTGDITGTPNVGDTYNASGVTHNFTVTADDGTGNTSPQSFNILRKWLDGSSSALAITSAQQLIDYGGFSNGTYYVNDGTRTRQYYVDLDGSEAGAAGYYRLDSTWASIYSGAACISGGGTLSSTGRLLVNTDNGGGGSSAHGGCGVSVYTPFRADTIRMRDVSLTGLSNCGGVDFPDMSFELIVAAGSSHTGSFTDYNYPGWDWEGTISSKELDLTQGFGNIYNDASYTVTDQDYFLHCGVASYGSCTNRPCEVQVWFKW